MKYIKTYENLTNDPQIGDYIKVDSSKMNVISPGVDGLIDFFDNEVGRITEINSAELRNGGYPYIVTFHKMMPNSMIGPSDYNMAFNITELLAWAPDMETLKIKIDAKKYNL